MNKISNLEKAILLCVVGIGWIVVSTVAVIKCNFLIAGITFGVALGHFIPVIFRVLKILSGDLKGKIKISPSHEIGFGLSLIFVSPFLSMIHFLLFTSWCFMGVCIFLHGTHRLKIIQQTNGDRR